MKTRNAFTLIELIFVVLLLGILAAVGMIYFRPGYLRNDTHFVLSRLEQTRYEAIGYDHRAFGGGTVAEALGCIALDRDGIEGDRSRAGAHTLHRDTRILFSGIAGNTLCFDAAGRPHDGGFGLSSLLHEAVDINVTNGRKSYRLRVYPVSGYVIMKRYD